MSNKTLYDLHILIVNYIESSHKTIKHSYLFVLNTLKDPKTYSDNDLKKVFESGDAIPFLQDNDVQEFNKNLINIDKKLKEYIDFVTHVNGGQFQKFINGLLFEIFEDAIPLTIAEIDALKSPYF